MTERLTPPENKAKAEKHIELKEMSHQEAADILFWSFYYSQGMPNLQAQLLYAISEKHTEIIAPQDEDFVLAELPRYKKFLGSKSHKEVSGSGLAAETQQKIEKIKEKLKLSQEDAYIYYNVEDE